MPIDLLTEGRRFPEWSHQVTRRRCICIRTTSACAERLDDCRKQYQSRLLFLKTLVFFTSIVVCVVDVHPCGSPTSPVLSLPSQCGKGGEWERCMALMERMRSEGIAPNVYSFSSLINACGKVCQGSKTLCIIRTRY